MPTHGKPREGVLIPGTLGHLEMVSLLLGPLEMVSLLLGHLEMVSLLLGHLEMVSLLLGHLEMVSLLLGHLEMVSLLLGHLVEGEVFLLSIKNNLQSLILLKQNSTFHFHSYRFYFFRISYLYCDQVYHDISYVAKHLCQIKIIHDETRVK